MFINISIFGRGCTSRVFQRLGVYQHINVGQGLGGRGARGGGGGGAAGGGGGRGAMKRTAQVSGTIEIDNAVCRLELTNIHVVQTPMPSAGSSSTSPGTTSPRIDELLTQIVDDVVPTHHSRKDLTSRQIQVHMCHIQRKYGLNTGVQGGWNTMADEAGKASKTSSWQLAMATPAMRMRTQTAPIPRTPRLRAISDPALCHLRHYLLLRHLQLQASMCTLRRRVLCDPRHSTR